MHKQIPMQINSFNFHVYLFWLPHLLNLDYHKIRKYWALILKMNNSILKTSLPYSKYHEINWPKYRGLLYLFDFKLFWTLMIIDKIVKSLCPFYSIEINKLWFIVIYCDDKKQSCDKKFTYFLKLLL